jgi:hypothetical protein
MELTQEPGFGRSQPDATIELSGPDGTRTTLLVEAKTTLNARDVPALLAQLDALRLTSAWEGLGPLLVTSRYIAPRTREMLASAGVSYADATGNVRIAIDQPALYLEGLGAKSDPWRGPERETRSLRGKPAARVVRALADFPPPFGIRELAERSGASVGSTYRTVDFLEKEALLTRGERGKVLTVDWRELLLRWSEDYDFQDSNRILPVLEPRGIGRVIEKLRQLQSDTPYAVTGSLSAHRVTQVAEPRLVAILTPQVDRLAEELELHEAAGSPNVLLARPFDDLLLARSSVFKGVTYSAFSQTAVDLMTGPGRDPVEAEELLGWMSANEEAWRG